MLTLLPAPTKRAPPDCTTGRKGASNEAGPRGRLVLFLLPRPRVYHGGHAWLARPSAPHTPYPHSTRLGHYRCGVANEQGVAVHDHVAAHAHAECAPVLHEWHRVCLSLARQHPGKRTKCTLSDGPVRFCSNVPLGVPATQCCFGAQWRPRHESWYARIHIVRRQTVVRNEMSDNTRSCESVGMSSPYNSIIV